MAGFGDALLQSGMARGFAARGKLAAFGDGVRVLWSDADHAILQGNPNVARPGQEYPADSIEWINSYVGHRPYGSVINGRWKFVEHHCIPGEVFLTREEKAWALGRIWPGNGPVVVIEPRVKKFGACDGHNKQWPVARYDAVAAALRFDLAIPGIRVIQPVPPGQKPLMSWAEPIETPTFRHALALVGLTTLYIGPEGGLHHGAAAMDTPAIVLFGGFNSPRSTGYPWHTNIAVGEPCGTVTRCPHCEQAMASITVERVVDAAYRILENADEPLRIAKIA